MAHVLASVLQACKSSWLWGSKERKITLRKNPKANATTPWLTSNILEALRQWLTCWLQCYKHARAHGFGGPRKGRSPNARIQRKHYIYNVQRHLAALVASLCILISTYSCCCMTHKPTMIKSTVLKQDITYSLLCVLSSYQR